GAVKQRRGDALSLFWFSQTVGLDRGLQDVIKAAGLAAVPIQIHLLGSVADEVRDTLSGIAAGEGLADALVFHSTCPPGEILSRAAEHDVGLALETDAALNRALTVTNKLLLYLTAGLGVLATDLPGQRSVLDTCSRAAGLFRVGDLEMMASHL